MLLESRIARLESEVSQLRVEVMEMKNDVRSLVVKQRPGAEDLDSSMRADASIDALAASVRSMRAWLIVFYFLFSAGILAALARGFGWI
jgi:hypothetical protein